MASERTLELQVEAARKLADHYRRERDELAARLRAIGRMDLLTDVHWAVARRNLRIRLLERRAAAAVKKQRDTEDEIPQPIEERRGFFKRLQRSIRRKPGDVTQR